MILPRQYVDTAFDFHYMIWGIFYLWNIKNISASLEISILGFFVSKWGEIVQ